MSVDLNNEEQAVTTQIERFSNEVLAPAAAAIDAKSQFATLHRAALAEMGIMGMNLPEMYGGIGLSGPALYCAVEAVAGACGSTASMLTAHFLATDSLLLGADEVLKQRLLPAAAAGEALGAFALTEPMAGSNPADMRSTATRDGDGYRLKGSKCFISNAGEADFIVVYAKTDSEAGARGQRLFSGAGQD